MGTIFFFLGFWTTVQQTILIRELLQTAFGNEFSLGLCLGNWLIGIAAGSLLCSRFSRRLEKHPERNFYLSLYSMVFAGFLSLIAAYLLPLLSSEAPGSFLPWEEIAFYSFLSIFPFSFFVGFTLPLAALLPVGLERDKVRWLTRLYALEALGSFSGGLLYAFLLVERFSPFTLSFLSGILLALFLLFLAGRWKRPLFRTTSAILASILFLTLIAGGPVRVDQYLTLKRWNSISGGRLVETMDTRYQKLHLGESSGQFNLFSNGRLTDTWPEKERNRMAAMQVFCQHPHPRRMLIVGEAVSGLAQSFLALPLEELVNLELDERSIRLIQGHLTSENRADLRNSRFRLIADDGRRYARRYKNKLLQGKEEPFDLILINISEPSTTLTNRFYTREFFHDLFHILSPGGVLAVPLILSENYGSGEMGRYNASIYRTVCSIYSHVALSPGPIPLLFAASQDHRITESPSVLQKRFDAGGLKPSRWRNLFPFFYPEERIENLRKSWNSSPAKINRDDHPVGFYYLHSIFGWYSGSRFSGFFARLEALSPKNLLIFPICILVFLILYMLFSGKSIRPSRFYFPLGVSLVFFGFASLTSEILLIYFFQNRFGYLYQAVSLFISFYMLGLSGGAWLIRRLNATPGQNKALRLILPLLGVFTLVLSLMLVPLSSSLFSYVLIFAGVFTAGMLPGVFIPALFQWASDHGITAARGIGWINALDHLGSAFGAFSASAFFLPLFGFRSTILLLLLLVLPAAFPILLLFLFSQRSK